jgi:hypothetical protein
MSKQDKTDALTTASSFAIVASPDGPSMLTEAFSQLGIDSMQLSRLKIPAGGGTQWAVNTLTGEVMSNHLDIIVAGIKGNEKVWWRDDFSGAGGPPTCSSHDGITGFGTPSAESDEPGSHACKTCPWNQWGSSRSGGPGKDCSDIAFLLFFQQDAQLPDLLVVPPSSLKAVRDYSMQLMRAGKNIRHVVTRLSLERAKSKGGIQYAQICPSFVRDLTDDEKAIMNGVSETVMASMMSATTATFETGELL